MKSNKKRVVKLIAMMMSLLMVLDANVLTAVATTLDLAVVSDNTISVQDEITTEESEELEVETQEVETQEVETQEEENLWEDTSEEAMLDTEVEEDAGVTPEGVGYSGSDTYNGSVYAQRLRDLQLTGDQRVDIVNVAKTQIGYHEGNSNSQLGGNGTGAGNYTEYGRVMGSNPNPWCAYFVSWCARRANVPTNIIANSSTANWNNYKVAFHYRTDGYTPRPGDLVFYKYEGSTAKYAQHVELVVGVDSKNITTVGGNTKEMVRSYSTKRTSTTIVGYGVPNYPSVIPVAQNPSVSYANISNGKQLTLSAPNCTIMYSLDGAGYTQYNYPISVTNGGNHSILAYSTRSGYTASSVISESFSVPKVPTPSISLKETPTGTIVTIAEGMYGSNVTYALDGGGYRNYSSAFTLTSSATVSAKASANGYAVSDVTSKAVQITKPSVPKVCIGNQATKVSVRDKAVVMWNAIGNAANYSIKVTKGEEVVAEKTLTNNSFSYDFPECGIYGFEVKASNNWGESDYSSKVTIEAMADVKVQFVDWDDSPLSEEYVIKYGDSVATPKAPTRVGYDFQGWSASYTNVTKDTIVKALYEKKKFRIEFYDQNGKEPVKSEIVEWDDAASPPDMSEKAAVGYVFSGWYVDPQKSDWEDYTKVEGKMSLYATYAWENENLPVTIRNLKTTCTYNDVSDTKGQQYYTATMNMYSSPKEPVEGRVIVEIKTSKGTTVAIATKDFTLPAGAKEQPVTIQVNAKSDGSVCNVYVVALDDTEDRTAGAMSKVATCNVEREVFYSDWSEWSTTQPEQADGKVIESKMQYRYNTKLTTTNSDGSAVSGYIYSYRDSHVGNWSGWMDNSIGSIISGSLVREVSTQSVPISTSYLYGHYCTGNISGAKYQTSNWKFNANCAYHSLGWFGEGDSRIVDRPDVVGGYYYYPSGTKYRCSNTCYTWYKMETSHTYKTQYRYRDTTYTYHYYKITDYTDWSDYRPTGSYYSLDSRIVYRYKTVTDENKAKEKEDAKSYQIVGKITDTEADLSGKIATVMVYRKTNTDPTQAQLQYLDQIVLGEENSYNFTVWPREEISADTGDYVVSLALEGATSLINAYVIPAPKKTYKVTFIAGGEVVSEQDVLAGNSADIPNAPELLGQKFTRWDESATNVNEDLVVNAIYETMEYVVVYLDEMNNTINLERANYNDALSRELPKAPEGYVCTGWDKDIVTGDMIVKAVFERPVYTVVFVDAEGETVSEQKVKYGNTALPPDVSYMIAPENAKIVGWSKDVEWWSVKSDMVVYPVVQYDKTVGAPYSKTPLTDLYIMKDLSGGDDELEADTAGENDTSGEEYPVLTLETETEGAEIYYTTDGSEPILGAETTKMYTDDGIVLYGDTQIKAIAVSADMNASPITELNLEVEEVMTADGYNHDDSVEVDLSEETSDEPEVGIIGDVNGDESINNKDVAYLAKYLVGGLTLTAEQLENADTNGDGSVNNKDVAKLARYLVGKEAMLGA